MVDNLRIGKIDQSTRLFIKERRLDIRWIEVCDNNLVKYRGSYGMPTPDFEQRPAEHFFEQTKK